MKTYYLVAREDKDLGHTDVFVTDNKNGYNVLIELEAKNYNEAITKFNFHVRNSTGLYAYCGAHKDNGLPYAGMK